jgi:hypothetical protein
VGLEVERLDELNATEVAEAKALATQLLQERFPTFDLRRGALHGLLLAPHAMLATSHSTNANRLRRSQSVVAIQTDPTIADDDLVDAVASNFGIVRKDGTKSSGSVTIVLSQAASVTIPSGSTWTSLSQSFETLTSFASRTSTAGVVETTDRVLTQLADGTYAFTIEVTALEAGNDSRLVKNTVVTPGATIPYFLRAYATDDFSESTAVETNTERAARLAEGAACKAVSGRIHMSALLKDRFPNTLFDSIIGFGDVEMVRDAHSIFPGSLGGRSDWYVRSATLPQRVTLEKTATLVSVESSTGNGIWQFEIERDDLPGFYDVSEIKLSNALNTQGTYEVTTLTRGYDISELTSSEFLPDIESAGEASFSRFQTAVVQFRDTDTATASLTPGVSTADYSVTLRGMPQIAAMQSYVSARSQHHFGADVLVRAPLPCFLSLTFGIQLTPGTATPDVDEIAVALSQAVNTFGFTGRLPAAYLASIVHDYLPTKAYVGAIDMLGRILTTLGTYRYIRSTDTLYIPDLPVLGVTGRTTSFVLEPADVAITLSTADIPAV